MNSQKVHSLFCKSISAFQNLRKTQTANSYLSISKGTRRMQRARKYKRPEDLEDPFYTGIGPKQDVQAACQSIAARGFAKEQPSYVPPKDVEAKLNSICRKVFDSKPSAEWKNQALADTLLKFKLLTKCEEIFQYSVPNSLLHKMKNVSDLLSYYSTPVDGKMHFDALVRDSEKLPRNLCVMPEGPVFHPDKDTFFDGVSAYPGRRRIVYTKTGEKFEKIIEWPNL